MVEEKFTQEIKKKTGPIWRAIFNHPFVLGIGDGTLANERYQFYLKQDYLYLLESSRVFGLASAKSDLLSDKTYWANILQGELNIEMDLHRRICMDFGIDAEDLEKTEHNLITLAFSNHLVRVAYEGSLADILAVILPCAAVYYEIAIHLRAKGLPDHQHYSDWINTYCSEQVSGCAETIAARLDYFATNASQEDKNRWFRLYRDSLRFELLFFDTSWNMSGWPEVVPKLEA